jgi:hypothetical protein
MIVQLSIGHLAVYYSASTREVHAVAVASRYCDRQALRRRRDTDLSTGPFMQVCRDNILKTGESGCWSWRCGRSKFATHHRLILPPPSFDIHHPLRTSHHPRCYTKSRQSDCPARSGLNPSGANATTLHALLSPYLALSGHCLPPALFSASSAICIKYILLSQPH